MSETLAQLYAVKHPDGYYKIGKASDATHRRSGIQTGSPYQLELEYVLTYLEPDSLVHDHDDLEDIIHSRLSARNVRGEWFDISERDLVSVLQEYADEWVFADRLYEHPEQDDLSYRERTQRYHDLYMAASSDENSSDVRKYIFESLAEGREMLESELVDEVAEVCGVGIESVESEVAKLKSRGEMYRCGYEDGPVVKRT